MESAGILAAKRPKNSTTDSRTRQCFNNLGLRPYQRLNSLFTLVPVDGGNADVSGLERHWNVGIQTYDCAFGLTPEGSLPSVRVGHIETGGCYPFESAPSQILQPDTVVYHLRLAGGWFYFGHVCRN